MIVELKIAGYRVFSIRRASERVRVLPDGTVEAWVQYSEGRIASTECERYWSAAHILSWTEQRNLRATATALRETRQPDADGVIRCDCTVTRDPASAHGVTCGLSGHEHTLAGRAGAAPADYRGESWTSDGVGYLDRGQRAPGDPVTCPMVGSRHHRQYLAVQRLAHRCREQWPHVPQQLLTAIQTRPWDGEVVRRAQEAVAS